MGALLGALGLDEATAGSALTDFAKQSVVGDAKSDLSGTQSQQTPEDFMKQLLGGVQQPQQSQTQGQFTIPQFQFPVNNTGGASFGFNPYTSLLGK